MYLIIEESFKPSKRPKQDPGDDTSDIEHLLDDHPISESNSVFVNDVFGWCCNIFLQYFFLFTAPKAKRQKQDGGVAKRLFGSQQGNAPPWSDDITPPSSPEHYQPSESVRYQACLAGVWKQCEAVQPVLGCTELSVTKHGKRKLVHI